MKRPSLQQVCWLVGPTALLLGAVLLTQTPSSPPHPAQGVTGPVTVPAAALRVIDGDTVEFQALNYRLTGYDTPEVRHADCEVERALGNRATAQLQAMIDSAAVIELRMETGRDRYGRGLAELWIDGRDVGPVLVGEGLARFYDGGAREGWC